MKIQESIDKIEYRIAERVKDIIDTIRWRYFMSEEEKAPWIALKKINDDNISRISLFLADDEIKKQIKHDDNYASMDVKTLEKVLIEEDAKQELGRVIMNEFMVTQEMASKPNKNFSSTNFKRKAEKIINDMVNPDEEGEIEDVDIEEDMELSSLDMADDIQDGWDI